MISELISESSSIKRGNSPINAPYTILDVRVSQNNLHALLDDTSGGVDSSHSIPSASNKIIKYTKHKSRVIPHPPLKDSDETSSKDSDEDLLPDLFTNFQPEDNEYSDCAHSEDQEASSSDEASSPQRKTPGKKKTKKKSIKSANPKIVGQKLNFYPAPFEEQEVEPESVTIFEKIINKWKQLK